MKNGLLESFSQMKEIRDQIILVMDKMNTLSEGYLIIACILIMILICMVALLLYLLIFSKRKIRLQKEALRRETTMILRNNSWK